MTSLPPLVYYQLENGRALSVRFRLVWSTSSEPRFEPMELRRPFGLPIGDGVPVKASADVLLEGSAYARAPGDTVSTVELRCADIARKLIVSGPRRAEHRGGRFVFSAASAFDRVPLDRAHAYGGGLGGDRPYPRNPSGKGFVTDDRFEGQSIELPWIEEGLTLTPDNLLARWEAWWRQPAPALVEPLLPTNMPRFQYLGFRASYPLPPPGGPGARAELLQEAPPHSRVEALPQGTSIEVLGCLPGAAAFRARAPRAPRVTLTVEGRRCDIQVRPQTIRIRPESGELSISYGIEHLLSRSFLPGIHARIPIVTEVEGVTVPFPTEEPLLRRIRNAQANANEER